MRPPQLKFEDPKLQQMFNALTYVLNNISKDNLKSEIVEGTTNSSGDTKALFKHGLSGVPSLWYPLEGDVYVPKNGFGASELDVRSRLASHEFRILVVL